jgi:hypothetical protein
MKCVPSCKIERSTLKNEVFHSQKWPVPRQKKGRVPRRITDCYNPQNRVLHAEKRGVARGKKRSITRQKRGVQLRNVVSCTPKTTCSVQEKRSITRRNRGFPLRNVVCSTPKTTCSVRKKRSITRRKRSVSPCLMVCFLRKTAYFMHQTGLQHGGCWHDAYRI